MKKTLLSIVAVLAYSSAFSQVAFREPPTSSLPPTPKQLEDFAAITLPYGNERFHKWTIPPRISLCDRATEYRPIVEKFVADNASILEGLPVIPTLVQDDFPTADILLIISDKPFNAYKARYHASPPGQWDVTFNADRSIRHYVLFLDGKGFKNQNDLNERRMIYRALYKAFGIAGDHILIPPIISLWGTFNEGTPENALWENDRKLVGFAYKSVPNFATHTDIRAAFKKFWVQ